MSDSNRTTRPVRVSIVRSSNNVVKLILIGKRASDQIQVELTPEQFGYAVTGLSEIEATATFVGNIQDPATRGDLILTRPQGAINPVWIRGNARLFDFEDSGHGCCECEEPAEALIERGSDPKTAEPFYWAVCDDCEIECKNADRDADRDAH